MLPNILGLNPFHSPARSTIAQAQNHKKWLLWSYSDAMRKAIVAHPVELNIVAEDLISHLADWSGQIVPKKSKTAKVPQELSKACYELYVAIHHAHRQLPGAFNDFECTRILSAVMAAKSFSWKVVGITEAALLHFAKLDFKVTVRSWPPCVGVADRRFKTQL